MRDKLMIYHDFVSSGLLKLTFLDELFNGVSMVCLYTNANGS